MRIHAVSCKFLFRKGLSHSGIPGLNQLSIVGPVHFPQASLRRFISAVHGIVLEFVTVCPIKQGLYRINLHRPRIYTRADSIGYKSTGSGNPVYAGLNTLIEENLWIVHYSPYGVGFLF